MIRHSTIDDRAKGQSRYRKGLCAGNYGNKCLGLKRIRENGIVDRKLGIQAFLIPIAVLQEISRLKVITAQRGARPKERIRYIADEAEGAISPGTKDLPK